MKISDTKTLDNGRIIRVEAYKDEHGDVYVELQGVDQVEFSTFEIAEIWDAVRKVVDVVHQIQDSSNNTDNRVDRFNKHNQDE